MYITCPDGQHVQYLNDDCYQSRENKGGVVVRQSYPIKPVRRARGKPTSQETSRTVMTNGTVIKVSHVKISIQSHLFLNLVRKCRDKQNISTCKFKVERVYVLLRIGMAAMPILNNATG